MTDSSKINVCVAGVGLIGGSLGLALKKNNPKKYVVTGWGRSVDKLRRAQRRGAVDRIETDVRAVQSADIVVMCIPVHKIAPQLKKMSRYLKQGAIVTDVGSVKKSVIGGMRRALRQRPDVRIVGAHPIAGSEKTGADNADAIFFKNATCVIATDGQYKTQRTAVKQVKQLWSDAGAHCVEMTAADHDRLLALTSHLPHLLAFALFQSVSDTARKNPVVSSLVAGSFRDMTRIAGADAELWAGVIDANRTEIKKVIRDAAARLQTFGSAPFSKLLPTLRTLQRAKAKWPTPR